MSIFGLRVRQRDKAKIFVLLGLYILFASFADAHPGALDASGGHYNHKTGEYHYHRRSDESKIQQHPAVDKDQIKSYESTVSTNLPPNSEKELKINYYFRSSNENVGALDCGLVIHSRDLGESTKEQVKQRDRNRCVICGSTIKLEVDHMRALENGGTNDISNLATLCDECHKIKTKYDNSLRRKRESLCGHKR